jgi:hypothetical protein
MCPYFGLPSRAEVFSEENLGTILVAVGIVFVLMGILDYSRDTSLISVLSLFVGISLTGTGFLVKTGFVESDSNDFSVRKKLGCALVVASVFLFTGAFVSFVVIEIGRLRVAGHVLPDPPPSLQGINHPNIVHYNLHMEINHPFYWLCAPLLSIGLFCLIAGAIMRYR